MIRKGLFLVCALLIPALLLAAKPSKSKGKNKKKAKTEQTDTASVKKTSDYDKLFKGKKCQTVKGLVTIHKVDGEKLYFELPMSIFGREMLLGSTVSETSNNDHGVVGYKAKDPLHVTFAKEGHKSVQLCLVNDIYSGDGKDKGIDEAVRRSSIPGIYRAFKIEAYNADSTAVVIDVTNLFMEDNDDLTPFDPYSTFGYKPFSRTTSFQKSNSHLGDIKAFEDNVTVKSYLSYTTTVTYSNGPMIGKIEDKRAFTALVTRTLLLLPEKEMRPRIADPRMNIFVTGKARFSSNMNRGTLPVYYARHWRVEPKDVEAYKRGELVEPVKPIVFYLDTNLPEAWKPYAREGIEQWNDAFEKHRLQERRSGPRLPHPGGGPRVRSRQPEILLHPLRPAGVPERHGPLVGRSPHGRDHHGVGDGIPRHRQTPEPLALPANRSRRPQRPHDEHPRLDHGQRPALRPLARGRTLPGLHAQHELRRRPFPSIRSARRRSRRNTARPTRSWTTPASTTWHSPATTSAASA